MPCTVTPTAIADVLVVEPQVFADDRGFFLESYNQRDFAQATGLRVNFVQDNQSRSRRGVLRGLHYQIQHPQGKLVRVTQGVVFDVVLDMRRSSPTFGRWVGETLSGTNPKHIWVPPGCAHGFLVLSDCADVMYKTTEYWYPEHERSILWSDPELGIDWPLQGGQPTLAAKDAQGTPWRQAQAFDSLLEPCRSA